VANENFITTGTASAPSEAWLKLNVAKTNRLSCLTKFSHVKT